MHPETIERIFLAIEVAIAGIHYAAVVAPYTVNRTRGRLLLVAQFVMLSGGLLALLYIFAGQFKALLLGIPFDAFSWLGVLAFTVFDVGSALVLKERHQCGRR